MRYRGLVRTSELLGPVRHGFTGVEEGDFRGPDAGSLGSSLVRALGGRGRLITTRQVHSASVVNATTVDERTEADAVVATEPGTAVGVRVADCVPILISAPGGVAAVHAGWRGTAADIVRIAVGRLLKETSTKPEHLRAAVGPCIRGCCYQVGNEVIAGVGAVCFGESWINGRNVDLAIANALILTELGVANEIVGPCTRCDAGYWSHRRDGEGAGRQIGIIVVSPS